MDTLMLVSTAVDLGAVALLGWLTLRGRRARATANGLHQQTLDSLRADLAQLVREAERRAQGLQETLAEREASLRALLADVARAESRRGKEARPERRAEKRRAARPREERETMERPSTTDPAEARLLRDLQISFAPPEA